MIAFHRATDIPLPPGAAVLQQLDARVEAVAAEVLRSRAWGVIASRETPVPAVRAVLREIYWEIHCYQPSTTKAGFAMIGRCDPADRRVMRTLLLHKWEEVEHRQWALDGYLALGGDASRVGREADYTSPGALAVAAVWSALADRLPALAYLGAEYLFEELTARLTARLTELLRRRDFPAHGLRFIVDHASEDEKHAELMRKLIAGVVNERPELGAQILYAFDCFRYVYPVRLWEGCLERVGQPAGSRPGVTVAPGGETA